MIFGTFFNKKANAASIIAIPLIATLCYVIVVRENYEFMNGVLNVIFVVIGYYFGSKQGPITEDDDDERLPAGCSGAATAALAYRYCIPLNPVARGREQRG